MTFRANFQLSVFLFHFLSYLPISVFLGSKDEGRGHKRTRTSEIEVGINKRLRGMEDEAEKRCVLEDGMNKLNRSPRVRILREFKTVIFEFSLKKRAFLTDLFRHDFKRWRWIYCQGFSFLYPKSKIIFPSNRPPPHLHLAIKIL